MALSGQIEFYKVRLIGGGANYTFRNFAKDHCYEGNEENPSENVLFTSLFQKILTTFDSQVNAYESLKKGVSIYHEEDVEANTILSEATNQKVIEGFVDGGYYGLRRKMSNMDKTEQTEITTNKIVTDRYYVYMFFPFTHNIGLLMIEKRGNLTVSKVVCKVLESVFHNNGAGIRSKAERFLPSQMVREFREGAVIDQMTYSCQVSSAVMGEGVLDEEETYDVTIQIKPRSEEYSYNRLNALMEKVNAMSFSVLGHQFSLGDFATKKGKLRSEGSASHPTFDVEEDTIRVVKNIPEDYYNEDDTLNRNQIKTFCQELLLQVSTDVYPIAQADGNQ